MNKKNLNCHPEDIEGSQPLHISPRDVAENAKLNHEITEELRKYTSNHSSSSSGLTRGSRSNKDSLATWILRSSRSMTRMYVLLSIITLIPTLAQAETCTTTPDCKSLGYTQTSCPDGGGVKCPWNMSLMYCGENGKKICADMGHPYTCTGANEIPSGKACSNKYYPICTCATGYEWKNGKCEKFSNGLHGDLYYCNGTVVGIKVPGQNFAIAMKDASSEMGCDDANSYCRGYRFCGTGTEGRLPTKNELLKIYNNITYLQDQLRKNRGSQFVSNLYWASLSNSGLYSFVNPVSGSAYDSGLNYITYVRPVLAF